MPESLLPQRLRHPIFRASTAFRHRPPPHAPAWDYTRRPKTGVKTTKSLRFSSAAKRLAKLAPRGSVGRAVPVERSTFSGRFVVKLPSRKLVSIAMLQGERRKGWFLFRNSGFFDISIQAGLSLTEQVQKLKLVAFDLRRAVRLKPEPPAA